MKLGRRSFLGLSAAAGVVGCVGVETPANGFDDNLTVFVTDIHVGGLPENSPNPKRRLEGFVDEVLAMRPRPKRVVSLGDLAYLRGLPEDYAASKPALKRLEAAGIELVFCMGNHDRRSAFNEAWPGHFAHSPVPGKFVRVVSLGTADLVVLDGLQGADDRPRTENGPVPGILHADVWDWCRKELPRLKRPFFVCSHFPIGDLKLPAKKKKPDAKPTTLGMWLIAHAPMCKGYIHGHDHRWRPEWTKANYATAKTLRTLCLPSNGLWGDIGYAIFRTSADRAVCTLEIRDFFFPREPETSLRPAAWQIKIEENRGQKVTFLYDRGEPK